MVHGTLHALVPALVAGPVLPAMLQAKVPYRRVLQDLCWDLGCLGAVLAASLAWFARGALQ